MAPIHTPRLSIRELTIADAPAVLEILNDASFLRYVGDRGVRTVADAEEYVRRAALDLYEKTGLGPFLVTCANGRSSMGICSLLQRDWLEDVDLGFAFLPEFRGSGFAHEAAAAVLEHARDELGLGRVVAITARDNERAERLLERLGLKFERFVQMPGEAEALRLFGVSLQP